MGTTNLNNARSLNESRQTAVALENSQVEGGLIFSVQPNHVSVSETCFEVTIKGWHLGSGSDISSVSFAGVLSSDIQYQSKHHVTLNVDVSGASTNTGDVVVTSSEFSTTLTNGFTFDAAINNVILENFETKLDMFYQSDDSNGWYFLDTNCPTGTDDICEAYGPASGDGMFALAVVDGSGRDASFEAKFSTTDCVDTVSDISVKYYAYSSSSQCISSDFLQIQVQYSHGGSWTTVSNANSKHSSNSQSWKTLSVTGLNSIVYGVKVLTRTYSPITNCDWWNPIAVDDITVSYTRECECATLSPTISHVPTLMPSTSSPTPNITISGDDDVLPVSTRTIIVIVIGAAAFIAIMMCFCWCDHYRARRKERMAAQRAERERQQEQELVNRY